MLVAAEPKEQTKEQGIFTVDFMGERKKEHFHRINDLYYFFPHIVEVYDLLFGIKTVTGDTCTDSRTTISFLKVY